jgi:hypothetical protein
MSDRHDDTIAKIALELPVELSARLDELQRQFGDQIIADPLLKGDPRVRSKFALRGARFNNTANKERHP